MRGKESLLMIPNPVSVSRISDLTIHSRASKSQQNYGPIQCDRERLRIIALQNPKSAISGPSLKLVNRCQGADSGRWLRLSAGLQSRIIHDSAIRTNSGWLRLCPAKSRPGSSLGLGRVGRYTLSLCNAARGKNPPSKPALRVD